MRTGVTERLALRRALRTERVGDSRTYVVCDDDRHIVAYYCLAAGQVVRRDAPYRARYGANVIGARALLVHALDESARGFYEAHGFVLSPVAPLTLMLAFKHLE